MKAFLIAAILFLPTVVLAHSDFQNSCDYVLSNGNFFEFERQLKSALRNGDPVALSFLVEFPLRINGASGATSLGDPRALLSTFSHLFPVATRNRILATTKDHLICNTEGIGYADGLLWIEKTEQGYLVYVVNQEQKEESAIQKGGRMRFVCKTKTHKIVVDEIAGGTLRYRSWNSLHDVSGEPDMQVLNGVETSDGTGQCAASTFTFTNASAVYSVGALGCTDGSEPNGTKGELNVTVSGKRVTDAWCF